MAAISSWIVQRLHLWAYAIRSSFAALLPLTLIGAMAIVLVNIPYPGYAQWVIGTFGAKAFGLSKLVVDATMGIMGLASAMVIAMRTAVLVSKHRSGIESTGASIAAVAGTTFLIVVLDGEKSNIEELGYMNIFQGIVIGVLAAELMLMFDRWTGVQAGTSRLENGISLENALRLSGQAVLTVTTLAVAATGARLGFEWIYDNGLGPLSALLVHADLGSVSLNLLLVLANQLLWTVGINGGQVLLHWSEVGTPLIAPPGQAYSATMASPIFVNTFGHLGGAGATWGLIVACLLRVKDPALRKLAWLSIPAALLNVNELLLLGIPLIFSRILWPAFVLAPLACSAIAMASMHLLGMSVDGPAVNWSVPVVLSGYILTGSLIGPAVQLVSLAVSAAIYAPFLKRLETRRRMRRETSLRSAMAALLVPEHAAVGLADRTDAVGDIARSLLADFETDLGGPRVTLAYQPQHARDGRIVGFEALLRWQHADYGSVSAQAIVNIVEGTEQIHRLGEWVIRQACKDLSEWRRTGLTGFKVGINLSPVQLESPSFSKNLFEALRAHQLDFGAIDVEITEGRMMSSTAQVDKNLTELQANGVPMSMDDFGMGCTSLLYMQRFKMSCIKLDGSLTRNVLTNAVNQDIIRCVARLGASQGVHIAAEFVEDMAQRDLLETLGCDYFQGWLYSKAVPAAEVRGYVERAQSYASLPSPVESAVDAAAFNKS